MSYTITTLPPHVISVQFDVSPDGQQIHVGDTLTITANITLDRAMVEQSDYVGFVPGFYATEYPNTMAARDEASRFSNQARGYFSVYGTQTTYRLSRGTYTTVTFTDTLTVTQDVLAGVDETDTLFVGFFVTTYWNSATNYMAIGSIVDLTVTTDGYTMPVLATMEYGDDATSDPLTTIGRYVQGVSEPTLTINTSNIQKDARIGYIAFVRLRVYRGIELISETSYRKYASQTNWSETIQLGAAGAISTAPMTWSLRLEDAEGLGATTTGSFDVLPYAAPVLTFGLTRYAQVLDDNDEPVYEETDDGENVWVDGTIDVTQLNGLNAWTLSLTWTPNDTGASLPVTLISESEGGSWSLDQNVELITSQFSAANDYTFTATLADQFGSSVVTTYIYKAGGYFNVEKFGVCVGGRTTGTAQAPKFESDYPIYAYAGIEGVNNYSTAEVQTGGHWIDGKPLYRKVIHVTAAGTTSLADLDFDFIRWEFVFQYTYNNDATLQWGSTYYWSGNNDRAMAYINGTDLIVRFGTYVHVQNAYIFLEYTKNTTTTT